MVPRRFELRRDERALTGHRRCLSLADGCRRFRDGRLLRGEGLVRDVDGRRRFHRREQHIRDLVRRGRRPHGDVRRCLAPHRQWDRTRQRPLVGRRRGRAQRRLDSAGLDHVVLIVLRHIEDVLAHQLQRRSLSLRRGECLGREAAHDLLEGQLDALWNAAFHLRNRGHCSVLRQLPQQLPDADSDLTLHELPPDLFESDGEAAVRQGSHDLLGSQCQ